jgi:hypothetical protein
MLNGSDFLGGGATEAAKGVFNGGITAAAADESDRAGPFEGPADLPTWRVDRS